MPETTLLPVDFLFTMHATLGKALVIPKGPLGTKVLVGITGGTVTGPRVNGTVLAFGGDWVTERANGVFLIDVRLAISTADGAVIYMEYSGLLGADRVARTAPLFQTSDERYTWLNDVQAIAIGLAGTDEVTYRVYGIS